VGAGLGAWWWMRTPVPDPPAPDLAEVDPEVAEAITAAQDKVRQNPKDGPAWGELGMVFRVHDFADESTFCFRQAERLDPANPRWPYLQGLTLVQSDFAAGIACLERAVARCGDQPLAPRLRLAETLLGQNRLDEAQAQLDQARKVDADDPRVQLGLGRLAMMRGQWREALKHLEECTSDVHARRLAHTMCAEAWTRLQQPDKARAEQEQAEQAPEDQLWPDPFVEEVLRLQRGLSIRLQRAHNLFEHQRYQQAIELMDDTLRRYPKSTAAWLLFGDIWRQLGQMNPDQQTPLLNRAELAFQQAVRIDPESADAWFKLGCVQGLSRPREGADSFQKAIRLKSDHTLAHYNLAQMLKKLDDPKGAAEEFRAALRCQPGFAPAQKALAEMEKK
jgi:tetratricopeptide (TPR) repeat protein